VIRNIADLFVLLSLDCGGEPPCKAPRAVVRMAAAPPWARRSRPRAAMIAAAACLAIMSFCACSGNRAADSTPGPAKVDANRPPLTLEQISHLDQKAFEHSLRQLRQVIDQTSPQAVVDQETLTALTGKLRQTDESAVDYWPTVLAFFNSPAS